MSQPNWKSADFRILGNEAKLTGGVICLDEVLWGHWNLSCLYVFPLDLQFPCGDAKRFIVLIYLWALWEASFSLPRILPFFIWKQSPDFSLEDHLSLLTGLVVGMGLNPSDLERGVGLSLANWAVNPWTPVIGWGWVQYQMIQWESVLGLLLELSAIVFPAVFKLVECISGAPGGSYTMWPNCIGLKSMNGEEKSPKLERSCWHHLNLWI